jgi:hypothetical protein
MASNEGKCCDAVLRVIEARDEQARGGVRVDRANDRGVEVECTIGKVRYAIEHTVIEPYPGKILDDKILVKVLDPVVAELRRAPGLPAGAHFNLSMDAGALAEYRGDHRELSTRILQWATRAIHTVPTPDRFGGTTRIDGEVGNPPIAIGIVRWGLIPQGQTTRIDYFRAPPYFLEKERLDRIRQACEKKLPKLLSYARNRKRTVLVLENGDSALTNISTVANALATCLKDFPLDYEPNEVYQVDTSGKGPWIVFPLRIDRRTLADFEYSDDHRYPEFDSATLIDVTGRGNV